MKKGFTLLELLIVIGILAILTTIVTVVLNPAQLLAQARDSQRLADLKSVNSALGLFVASASSTTSFAATSTVTYGGVTCPFSQFSATCATNSSTTVAGLGWVAVNFGDIPSGAPLAKLPIDPSNGATYYYAYAGSSSTLTWELDAKLESAKYSPMEGTDGGNKPDFYEIGTDPGLDI